MSAKGHHVLSFSVMREIATGTLVAARSRTVRGENSEAKDAEGVENLFIARMVSSIGSHEWSRKPALTIRQPLARTIYLFHSGLYN